MRGAGSVMLTSGRIVSGQIGLISPGDVIAIVPLGSDQFIYIPWSEVRAAQMQQARCRLGNSKVPTYSEAACALPDDAGDGSVGGA